MVKQKTLSDYTDRFWVLLVVTCVVFVQFVAFFLLAGAWQILEPLPTVQGAFVPELIFFGVIFVACLIGIKDDRPLFRLSMNWLSLKRRDNLLVFATFSFIVFIAYPCFALGGPFVSGFGHLLVNLGAIMIIVTDSNRVRGSILVVCMAAFIISLLWPLNHVEVKHKFLHEAFLSVLTFFSLILTVFLTWGTAKGSIFDNITSDQTPSEIKPRANTDQIIN